MPTIGKISIALEAQSTQLQKVVADSTRDLRGFGKEAQEAGGHGGGFLSMLGAGAAIGAGFAVAHAAIHLVAEALTEATHAAIEWVASSVEAGDSAYKLAGAMGVSTEALLGIGAMAKTEADLPLADFATTLQKLQKNLGEAAQAGGPVSAALARLGLNAQSLANQKLDESFLQVAEAISKIHNPAERATAVVDLFGKSGQKLLPMFEEGRAGIEAAAAKAKEMGVALTDFDAAKLSAVKQNIEQMGLAFEGVKNQLALALAPVLIELGQQIVDLLPKAETVKAVFISGLHAVATGIAYVIDAYQLLKMAIFYVGDLWIQAGAKAVSSFQAIGDSINWLLEKLHLPTIDTGFLKGVSKEVEEFAGTYHAMTQNELAKPLATEQVDAFFARINNKAEETAKEMNKHKTAIVEPITKAFDEAAKKIDETLADMAKSIGQFGLNEGQKKIFDLTAMGASPEQLEVAQAYAAELQRLQDEKDSMDELADYIADRQKEAEQLTEQSRSPAQKYQDEIAKINGLFEEGLIDQDTYFSAIGKANKDLNSALKADAPQHKDVAAQTRRFDFSLPKDNQPSADPMRELVQQGKRSEQTEQQMRDYLRDIYRYTRDANAEQDLVVDF